MTVRDTDKEKGREIQRQRLIIYVSETQSDT